MNPLLSSQTNFQSIWDTFSLNGRQTFHVRSQNADVDLTRAEMKFLIHPREITAIRRQIAYFLVEDPHSMGGQNEPITIQCDGPRLPFGMQMKDHKYLPRIKLRIRFYRVKPGERPSPVFLEIKRRTEEALVVKTRTKLSWEQYHEGYPYLLGDMSKFPGLQHIPDNQLKNLFDFSRILKATDSRPVLAIRYKRSSFKSPKSRGLAEFYSRATIDADPRYMILATGHLLDPYAWHLPVEAELADNRLWKAIPVELVGMQRAESNLILELKTNPKEVEEWMLMLRLTHEMRREGYSKYSSALVRELGDIGADARDFTGAPTGEINLPYLTRSALISARKHSGHLVLAA